MNTMMKKVAGIAMVGMLVIGLASLKSKAWADDPAVVGVSTTALVDVLVTPIVTVDLTASTTKYNFGLLNVNSSSYSATAVTLTNTGNVGVSMQKRGHNTVSGNWTIATSSALNQFTLYAATASARPSGVSSFVAADKLSTALSNLQGIAGATQVTMNPAAAVSLWFGIDMPTATTFGAQQTITVNFVGTAQ